MQTAISIAPLAVVKCPGLSPRHRMEPGSIPQFVPAPLRAIYELTGNYRVRSTDLQPVSEWVHGLFGPQDQLVLPHGWRAMTNATSHSSALSTKSIVSTDVGQASSPDRPFPARVRLPILVAAKRSDAALGPSVLAVVGPPLRLVPNCDRRCITTFCHPWLAFGVLAFAKLRLIRRNLWIFHRFPDKPSPRAVSYT